MNDSEDLRHVCEEIMADPHLQPVDGKTYCNFGVTNICAHFGHDDFIGKTANEIYDYCYKNLEKISGLEGNELANEGFLVIAAQKGKPHGHVAVVYPGAMVYSTHWKKECPVVANVGRRNGVMGANWAFVDEPHYFTFL